MLEGARACGRPLRGSLPSGGYAFVDPGRRDLATVLVVSVDAQGVVREHDVLKLSSEQYHHELGTSRRVAAAARRRAAIPGLLEADAALARHHSCTTSALGLAEHVAAMSAHRAALELADEAPHVDFDRLHVFQRQQSTLMSLWAGVRRAVVAAARQVGAPDTVTVVYGDGARCALDHTSTNAVLRAAEAVFGPGAVTMVDEVRTTVTCADCGGRLQKVRVALPGGEAFV